jgi:hypothetical protein
MSALCTVIYYIDVSYMCRVWLNVCSCVTLYAPYSPYAARPVCTGDFCSISVYLIVVWAFFDLVRLVVGAD